MYVPAKNCSSVRHSAQAATHKGAVHRHVAQRAPSRSCCLALAARQVLTLHSTCFHSKLLFSPATPTPHPSSHSDTLSSHPPTLLSQNKSKQVSKGQQWEDAEVRGCEGC
ncbi:hypothetical protein E2C01_097719 [Portunus trituberculatus]|uniref:Uncharacterized protein n=1 Tax=Portunus trituberculatus TaxID=210409 RepID=A0A5B7KAR8_PORTR|nr:hypothetical protein [Portunus trituberculatus]